MPRIVSNLSFVAMSLVMSFGLLKALDASGAEVCDDLFAAACLDKNGESKFEEGSAAATRETKLAEQAVSNARDAGAKALGYANFQQGLKAELAKRGLALREGLDPSVLADFAKTGRIAEADAGLTAGAACAAEVKSLTDGSTESLTSVAGVNAEIARVKKFKAAQRTQRIAYLAQDITSFVANRLASECMLTKGRSADQENQSAAKRALMCERMPEIKREAIAIWREEDGSSASMIRAQKFVSMYLKEDSATDDSEESAAPVVDESAAGFASTEQGASKPQAISASDPLATAKKALSSVRSNLKTECYLTGVDADAAISKTYRDFALRVNRSKPTIESLVQNVYSNDRRQKVQTAVTAAKADLEDVISQVIPDQSKRAAVLDGYSNLDVHWMEKPAPESYSKDARGQLSLNGNEYSRLEAESGQGHGIDVDSVTSDPSLAHFTTTNATYQPEQGVGRTKYAQAIEIFPGYLPLAETNPQGLSWLIAHEVGHRIGVNRGHTNGYDLRKEYAPLLACYADSKSIRMQPSQQDETIADYLASEVLARQLSRLPKADRQSALVSAMAPACLADNEGGKEDELTVHPAWSQRLSGVFGASPNLRASIGCSGSPKDYRTCGLPNAMNTLTPVGTRPATPVKSGGPGAAGSRSAK